VYFWVDVNIKPFIYNVKYILLTEDAQLIAQGQQGAVGECMEFAIRSNMFMELIALAQSNHPEGMFVICLDVIIELIYKIKSMPIIHNNNMHKSLLQMNRFIFGYLASDIIEINDPDEMNLSLRVILDFLKIITHLGLDVNPEISKFFIEEASNFGKSRGT
jgi:hypothetical protein